MQALPATIMIHFSSFIIRLTKWVGVSTVPYMILHIYFVKKNESGMRKSKENQGFSLPEAVLCVQRVVRFTDSESFFKQHTKRAVPEGTALLLGFVRD